MAKRRMFSQDITDSDVFLDMPLSTQALYFHLGMNADDDGFVNNPKKVQRGIGASNDDMQLLAAKRFIIVFESGIIVIKHWKINNSIRGDRKKDTNYDGELMLLSERENGTYYLLDEPRQPSVNQVSTTCQPNDRVGKDRLGKDRLGKPLSGGPDVPAETREIVDYLNAKAGTAYRPTTARTKQHISARLADGYTVDDFKAVIDRKVADWGDDPKMARYLRPETLFNPTKFENYLNEAKRKEAKRDSYAKYR